MMPGQNIFSDVAPLSSEAHGDWSLQREGGYGFARQMSAAPLVLREMAAAAREFPVAFAREGGGVRLFAVLGLKKGENLFVRADGRWDGGYVPAGLRQYPFVIGRVKDSDRALLSIDQGYAGFNRKGEGEALFGENGEVSEFVAKARDFAEELAKSSALTERFCKTLADLDVLSPMRITLAGPDGEKREIDGLRTVDRDKLKALPGDKVKELLESNSMELIFLHLQSLGNLRSLASRIPKEQGSEALAFIDDRPSRYRSVKERRREQKAQRRRVMWEEGIQKREQFIADISDLLKLEDLNITALRKPERKIASELKALGWQISTYHEEGVRKVAIAQAEKQKITLRELAQRVEALIAERKAKRKSKHG